MRVVDNTKDLEDGGYEMHQPFLTIFILNLLTSIDNAIVLAGIANRYKNLFAIALTSAVVLTICRTVLIVGIVSVTKFPGLRFTLGLVVLLVAINLANVKIEGGGRQRLPFWNVLFMVVMTDLALSIDTILSVAVISKNVFVIASSVFLSLLPLLLLLPFIVRIMNKVIWLRILAAGFVTELAVDSITDDPWVVHRIPGGHFELFIRIFSAVIVVLYGFWKTYSTNRSISA